MLALSFGLLLVMGTVALLLADMERKRSQELEKSGQTRPLAGLDAIPVNKRHQHIERRLRGIEAAVAAGYDQPHP